ncbi:MAG: A/G-specific adenine glycosylase [Verrucomicrobiota bacterium]
MVPALLDWFSKSARDLPWRRTRDPYAIWVSEIMLQQTQVKTVMPYWKCWMRELPTIEAAANASPDKIHKLWEGLGYYTRTRNLQKAAQQIVARHGGRFPQNFDNVLALPGIGRYTAGAICSIAFNQPVPILDGNVIRVLTRIFGIGENPREKKTNARLWRLAEELVGRAVPSPPRRGRDTAPYHSFLNQSLMELGALVCAPRNPQCQICPAKKLCVAFCENRVEALPNLGKRTASTARHFVAFVVERNGRFLVRQRPAGAVNAYLWEFPNVEVEAGILPAVEPGFQPSGKITGSPKPTRTPHEIPGGRMPPSPAGRRPAASSLARAAKNLGFELSAAKPLCTVKHSITRYRITLEAFRVQFGGANSANPKKFKMGCRGTPPSGTAGVWRTPAQMRQLAFTAAHKKLASFAANRILSG